MTMTHTLVLYFVLEGKVQISKIKQATESECAIRATTFTMVAPATGFKPLHAECISKEKKAPKLKAPAAINFKRMT